MKEGQYEMWTEEEVMYALNRARWFCGFAGFAGGVVFCLLLGLFA